MNAQTYTGIKIRMVDGKGKMKDGKEEKLMYGIQKITIDSNVYKAILVDCDDESPVNKWELYDIKWLDVATRVINIV